MTRRENTSFSRYYRGLNRLPALGVLAAALAGGAVSAAPPQNAVFRGGGSAVSHQAYADWLGIDSLWPVVYLPAATQWSELEGPTFVFEPWREWKRQHPAERIILGVPMMPRPAGWKSSWKDADYPAGAATLEEGAKGAYNAHLAALARSLVAAGMEDTILRLGWEFTGNWMYWRVGNKSDAYAAYWRQIVDTMRAVPGAEKLRFDWNPNIGPGKAPAELAWPGDSYVDYIGLDIYDNSWLPNTYPLPKDASEAEILARQKRVWNEQFLNGDHGLVFWSRFAARHKKPLSFPEWGVDHRPDNHSGLDDSYFVEQMHKFITDPANNVAYQAYFDYDASDGHHRLSPGGKTPTEFPRAAASFRRLFGAPPKGSARTTPSSLTVTKNAVAAEGDTGEKK